jgi:DNA-binding NarL/FixJ family response regulator
VAAVTTRVLIVEDHPIVADGLRAALAGRLDLEVVARADTVASARALLDSVPCDVVLLDLRLPDGSGVELLETACHVDGPAFLVLSSFDNPEYVAAATRLGASGFLLKTAPTGDILAAIVAVADGRVLFTGDEVRAARTGASLALTARERAVVAGLVRGRSNDELAGDLSVSRKTVEAYVTRLLARYGFASRTELAIHADRAGLLDLPTREARSPN